MTALTDDLFDDTSLDADTAITAGICETYCITSGNLTLCSTKCGDDAFFDSV